jgi:DUF4097 and DUF4098 domain-containing protein YvlB
MLPVLAAVTVLALSQGETDTTVTVRQGQRLDIADFGGAVVVKAWRQNALRVRATHSSRDRIQVSATGATVSISASGRYGPSLVDYEILAPAWMPVSVAGSPGAEVTIEGTQAAIAVETVEGSINVVGGSGNVSLRTVEGSITLRGARGRIELNSVDGSIEVRDCSGVISAETVDGDIMLLGIESADVSAGSVDGAIEYEGTIQDGGRYRLTTHDGNVTVAIPERANATVSVATFGGTFEPCFPVTVRDMTRHRFTFAIGSGSARIELESFDGVITLCRPGQVHNPDTR